MLSGLTCGAAEYALALVTPPAHPASSTELNSKATDARRAAFLLVDLNEVNMLTFVVDTVVSR